jgi:hypothetical protein
MTRQVPVEKIVYQDRIVYQDQVVYQDRIVEVPVERVIQYNQPREGPSVQTGVAYVRETIPQNLSISQGAMYSSQRVMRQVGLGLLLKKNDQNQV